MTTGKRIFGGKVYTLDGTYRLKSSAQGYAKKVRDAGGSARVVKDTLSGGWDVYAKGRRPRF